MLTVDGKPVDTHPFFSQKFEGDATPHLSTEEKFTGAVHLYYDTNMLDEERVELRKIFSSKQATIISHPKMDNK